MATPSISEYDKQIIKSLEQASSLVGPVMQAAIDKLHLPPGSCGLDIGCGIGLQTLLLAGATQADGHITGLDISGPILEYARHKVSSSPLADHIRFVQGDMNRLPFEDDSFDFAWSADCVGYPAGDLLPVLMEISRVVRPGGLVTLLAWSSQQLLPGHMLLEARLNATCSAYAPFLQGQPATAQFQRALRWFPAAGIIQPACNTIVGQVQAPLALEVRDALTLLFGMLWDMNSAEVSAADREEYRRLCSPGSADFILDVPEYAGFFTYTMFTGRVDKKRQAIR